MNKLSELASLTTGQSTPMGATLTSEGINFAVFSEHATAIELCLFDASGQHEVSRQRLPGRSGDVWHGFLPDGVAGCVYGLRAHGPDSPESGHRFAPAKLLLDPYARELTGSVLATDSHLANEFNEQDNSAETVKAVVVATGDFDWQSDELPCISPVDTVLYELHVKGFSQQLDSLAAPLRGSYEGLCSPQAIAHFRKLGVTSINLLPVHQSIDEMPLARRGQVNYWGYNTLSFFTPSDRYVRNDPRDYPSDSVRDQFRRMVRGLHHAGIEVILDVVYNHTAEGDQRGPTLSWRGLDNANYYLLSPDNARYYENHSGCGNTMNLAHPQVRLMVLDSLRYWATEMHVDGFRFDLASILARGEHGFDQQAPFFQEIAADPVLSQRKMIAEPWDLGPGGYQLGHYPNAWSEWNDRFRGTVRGFWLGNSASRGELAARLTGSSDIFGHTDNLRGPAASINFVCAHDGFTLHDLVSFNQKHNEANGEDNRDGTDNNQSWNCGHEGPSDLLAINSLRTRMKRAMLATLLVSRGIPMLLAGDEISRTQQGNNNAFIQDNAVSWLDWHNADQSMLEFVGDLIALRRRYPQLHALAWLNGQVLPGASAGAAGEPDVQWLDAQAQPITGDAWDNPDDLVLGMLLDGEPAVLVVINGGAREVGFALPAGRWRRALDTAVDDAFDKANAQDIVAGNAQAIISLRSLVVFERTARKL